MKAKFMTAKISTAVHIKVTWIKSVPLGLLFNNKCCHKLNFLKHPRVINTVLVTTTKHSIIQSSMKKIIYFPDETSRHLQLRFRVFFPQLKCHGFHVLFDTVVVLAIVSHSF